MRPSAPHEPISSHSRTLHKYSRSPNFSNVVDKYDHPKCKLNLDLKLIESKDTALAIYNPDSISRSSLNSIASLDLDRRRPEFCTRSLPRRKANYDSAACMYRTRSHSGFINSYIKDPEPIHFHVPKYHSCGAVNKLGCEIPKINARYKQFGSLYYSIDNIHQDCDEKEHNKKTTNEVKIKEIEIQNTCCDEEFVESQEFNEDNYIGDLGTSFSSDNETVIETNQMKCQDDGDGNYKLNNDDVYRAECVVVEIDSDDKNSISFESVEGEYHSFNEDMFEQVVYESPVKDLVDKDIRDYSVPIVVYCEDYNKNKSPRKSPVKKMETVKQNILEPILEESKSSYGESSNDSNKIECKNESTSSVRGQIEQVNSENETVDDDISTSAHIKTFYHNTINNCTLPDTDCNKESRLSCETSSMSGTAIASFDSTAEFEKFEVISEVLAIILTKINYELTVINSKFNDVKTINIEEINLPIEEETFSITEIINDIEVGVMFNDTPSVEISDSYVNDSEKIVESIVYYIFDYALCICTQKHKIEKKPKSVVTIVDVEDIIHTTCPEWINFNNGNYVSKEVHLTPTKEQLAMVDRSDSMNEYFSDKSSDVNEDSQEFLTAANSPEQYVSNEFILKDYIDEDSETVLKFLKNCIDNKKCNDSREHYTDTFVADVISDILERSLLEMTDSLQRSDEINVSLNETFVLKENEIMNEAFIDVDCNRSSLPSDSNALDLCEESPIKANSSLEDSSLYERDESIFSSPFVKRSQVLSMSQKVHTGGIKYWLSFDDNLVTGTNRRKFFKKVEENQMPSFVLVDLKEDSYEKELIGLENNDIRRPTVLLDEYGLNSNPNPNGHFSPSFNSFDSEDEGCKEKLIYDSREVNGRRLASSWPPFEDSLFYKIITNFKMSESLDLSDLSYTRFENCL
ncbi:uncharacterized protein LOC126973307 [Leptidea sinapis]|uniref:uncharacterized protein LOC126973307 n=1 Tax=Leptidea sinapis TaxID=189913 RepID=UPI0021C3DBC4|nr:uncharacterized protein LOC126973307 [Leptidea sinapis]